jgi:NADH:ubiquinone oxidoreductase subunit H
VAGSITEYSPIYSSPTPSTEYASTIAMTSRMIIPFPIIMRSFILFPFLVRLIRSTFNRLKFDELMSKARIVTLPISFTKLLYTLIQFHFYRILDSPSSSIGNPTTNAAFPS